jgi:hypothetical protein
MKTESSVLATTSRSENPLQLHRSFTFAALHASVGIVNNIKLNRPIPYVCRSQWPLAVRQKLFSLARTLGSWVRIPLKTWMFVSVYSVLFCVQVAALRQTDHSSKESYRLCKKGYETEEDARVQQKDSRVIDRYSMFGFK